MRKLGSLVCRASVAGRRPRLQALAVGSVLRYLSRVDLTFRKAEAGDSELLFRWRNDPETRAQSFQTAPVLQPEHEAWFSGSLQRADRKIFIAEAGNSALGMVRFDQSDGAWELSWVISPEQRGKGWGKKMLAAATKLQPGALTAKIKRGNLASEQIAVLAGFRLLEEKDGVGIWRRD